jgi:hypothetical protein
MNRKWTPALVLGLLYAGFFVWLALSRPSLPPTMAIHFGAAGIPDSWTSSSQYLRDLVKFGLGFPLFVPAMCLLTRVLPAQSLKIPHHDYWLAPARRGQFSAYLFRHSLWFASMALGFVIGLHFCVIRANSSVPAHLSPAYVLPLGGCFIAGTAFWVVSLLRHLNRVETAEPADSAAVS